MEIDKDGRRKKRKSHETAVEKTTSEKMDAQVLVDNIDRKKKKRDTIVNADAEKATNQVTEKNNSNKTTVENTICEDADNNQDFMVDNDDKNRKKRRRIAHADAEVTEQVTMDQTFPMVTNNEKRTECKKNDKAITINIDSSGEGKSEDAVVSDKSDDTITARVSKENDDKEEPPVHADTNKKSPRRARRKKNKSSSQNDTFEIPEGYDQEDCFRNETITEGRQGGKIAVAGKLVNIKYVGKLKDGTVFEDPGYPLMFRLGMGEVIDGWDVGINGMCIGEVRYLRVPPAMGFGAKKMGKTPPNSTLHFQVTLVNVWD